MEKYQLSVLLRDKRAIEIVKNLPITERDKTIEKYIIIGDTVIKYASIVTSEASLQQFFEPISKNLTVLSEDLQKTVKHLEGKIPDALNASLRVIAKQLEGTASSFEQQHKNYSDMLSQIFPKLAKSVEKGAISSEIIFNSLLETFREDRFEDVSGKARFTDIIGIPPFASENAILIENKEWTQPVATAEVDKFWRDMEARNASVGCFFSMSTPIRSITNDFAIVPRGSKVGIFVVNEAFNHKGHIFGYMVARKILEMMLGEKTNIETGKYQLIAHILNNRLQELKDRMDDLESIENEIWRAKEGLNKTLERLAAKVSKLRQNIETVIEMTFKDFSRDVRA